MTSEPAWGASERQSERLKEAGEGAPSTRTDEIKPEDYMEVGPLTGLSKVYKPDLNVQLYDWVCTECGNVMFWGKTVCSRHNGTVGKGGRKMKLIDRNSGVRLDTLPKVKEATRLAQQYNEYQGRPPSESSKWSRWSSKDRAASQVEPHGTSGASGSAAGTFDPSALADGRGLIGTKPVPESAASDAP